MFGGSLTLGCRHIVPVSRSTTTIVMSIIPRRRVNVSWVKKVMLYQPPTHREVDEPAAMLGQCQRSTVQPSPTTMMRFETKNARSINRCLRFKAYPHVCVPRRRTKPRILPLRRHHQDCCHTLHIIQVRHGKSYHHDSHHPQKPVVSSHRDSPRFERRVTRWRQSAAARHVQYPLYSQTQSPPMTKPTAGLMPLHHHHHQNDQQSPHAHISSIRVCHPWIQTCTSTAPFHKHGHVSTQG